MFRSSFSLFSKIRPSTLRVRVPRVGFCDDSKNVNRSLRGIRRELGPLGLVGRKSPDSDPDFPEDSSSYGPPTDNPDSTYLKPRDESTLPLAVVGQGLALANNTRAKIDSKNKFHKSLWVAMKRRDSLSFDRICKQLRNSGLELDAVSYTLMINGTLIFSKPDDMDKVLSMIDEMKELGIHPSLIRFLSRLICMYLEMCYYNSRPLISNWLSVTRSSWLSAYLINNKYKSQ